MERERLTEAMKAAISNVMETMFFKPVRINENGCALKQWFSSEQSLLGASLDFTGPFSGRCFLLIPANLNLEITANFLGLNEKEVDEEQKRDTIKEALNMIGGHMFSLLDREGLTRLGIPELLDAGELAHDKLSGINGSTVLIDTGKAHLAAGINTGAR